MPSLGNESKEIHWRAESGEKQKQDSVSAPTTWPTCAFSFAHSWEKFNCKKVDRQKNNIWATIDVKWSPLPLWALAFSLHEYHTGSHFWYSMSGFVFMVFFSHVSVMKICIKCSQLKRVVGFADKEQRLILAKWIRSKESNFFLSHPGKVTKLFARSIGCTWLKYNLWNIWSQNSVKNRKGQMWGWATGVLLRLLPFKILSCLRFPYSELCGKYFFTDL